MKNEQEVKDLLQIVVDAKNTTGTIQNIDFINLIIGVAIYLVGEPKPTVLPQTEAVAEPKVFPGVIEMFPEVILPDDIE